MAPVPENMRSKGHIFTLLLRKGQTQGLHLGLKPGGIIIHPVLKFVVLQAKISSVRSHASGCKLIFLGVETETSWTIPTVDCTANRVPYRAIFGGRYFEALSNCQT